MAYRKLCIGKVPALKLISPSFLFISQSVLIAAAYFIGGKYSLYAAIPPGNASAPWISSAIALCACMTWGKRMLPAIWAGAMLLNLTTSVSLTAAVIMASGNTLEVLAATLMMQRWIGPPPYFSRIDNVFRFVVIAILSSLIAASIAAGSLALLGHSSEFDVMRNWITWWLGDTTCIIIVVPLILVWNQTPRRRWTPAWLAEIALFGIALLATAQIVFKEDFGKEGGAYMTVPFVIWAAFRYGPGGVARTLAIIAAVSVWGTIQGLGPFAMDQLNESLLSLQLFLSIIAVTGIAQAALLEQREYAERRLREERDELDIRVKDRTAMLENDIKEILRLEQVLIKREHQLAEAQRIAHLGSWEWDIDSNTARWSDEMCRIFDVEKHKFAGSFEEYLNLVHPGDLEMVRNIVRDSMQTHAPFRFSHRIRTPHGAVKNLAARGFVVTNESGSAVRMLGTAQDITELTEAENQLRDAEKRYRDVVELSPGGIFIVDAGGRNVFANSAALTLCGANAMGQVVGRPIFDFLDPSCRRFFMEEIRQLQQISPTPKSPFEGRLIKLGGNEIDVEMSVTRFTHDAEPASLLVMHDITERKRAERKFRGLLEAAPDAMVIVDQHGKIVLVNSQTENLFGHLREEILGKGIEILIPERLRGKPANYRTLLFDGTKIRKMGNDMELYGRRKDGGEFPIEVSLAPLETEEGILVSTAIRDITDRKEAESRIQFMAEHDFLTGLPTRALLLDRLGQAIESARRSRTRSAVLFIDLDRFKNINDSMGHNIGDKLLKSVAARLQRCVRSIDTVSRQGGDEFIIILADIGNIEQVGHIADNIMKAIALAHRIDEHEIHISSSIGISMYPNDGSDIDTLIKHADIAMYHAKESGRNDYQFFSDDMNARIAQRLALENSLRKAIDRNELLLHYQPQMEIASGRTVGAEALIRWQHPDLGLLLPAHFISIAEECGLIVPIGDWVLRAACQQARSWADNGLPMIVSVNLSVAQFRQKNLLGGVSDALKLAGLEAKYLKLEITESILADEEINAVESLKALRKIGVKLAIDDFGTGYSSLSYLRRLAVDTLKIDQSFVRDITVDSDDAAITSAIIAMARTLRLKVIAEGVETKEQLRFLELHGCDEFQGYYSSQALSSSEFAEFRALH